MRELAEGSSAWGIPWPCVHEFLSIVTHPRIYRPPSTIEQAVAQVEAWLASPSRVLLAESEDHWSTLSSLALRSQLTGPRVHDARIACICADHGVRELWTADRDFSNFPVVRVRNPLV
jgi:predicted nucleic acid-binding protein